MVLSATGFAGNECAPEFDDAQMDTRVPTQTFSPGTEISFSFNAADIISDEGVGATATDDIRFFLDPDVDANFRNNGSTPAGATLVANDPANNDQWDFSWTPIESQTGTFRLFIIATDLGGDGTAGPVVPLSDVYVFSLTVDSNPVVDLNGDGDGENAGIDFGPVTYTENQDPVTIVDDDLSIPFAANDMVASATIELTNPQEGDVLAINVPDGSPLEIDPTSTSSSLLLTVNGAATLADKADFEAALRELTFENTTDEPGSVRRNITVTINDGNADSDAATTSVDTIATNDRPVLTPDDGTLPDATVGTAYTFDVVAEDPDAGDLLVFQIQAEPAPESAVIAPNAGGDATKNTIQVARGNDGLFRASVTWTPTQADLDAGSAIFVISVTDQATVGIPADSELYEVSIANREPTTVDDPESEPTTSTDDFAVDENNAADVGNILDNDNDPDGDTLAVEAVMTTEGGDAVADPTSFTTEQGALVTIDGSGNVSYDPNGMFETLAAGDTATDEFWYTVNDGRSAVSTPPAKVTITVFGRNDAPRALTVDDDPNFVTPEFSVNEDDGPMTLDTATILAAAFDIDQGDVINISAAPADTDDGSFSFTAPTDGPTSAILTFDPAEDAALLGGETKIVDVMVEVEDLAELTALIPIRIVVTGVTIGPEANNDSEVTAIDTPVSLNVIDNDTSGDASIDPATVDLNPSVPTRQTSTVVAGEGTFSVDDAGNVTFTPEAEFVGTSTIQYIVTDSEGETSSAADIAVRVNAPPVASDDTSVTMQETAVVFNITDNDTDSDGTIDPATIDLNPATGTRDFIRGVQGVGVFTVNDTGVVTFTPEADFSGIAVISYTVNDNDGATSEPSRISVLVNDPPTAVDDPEDGVSYTTAEDETLTISQRTDGVLGNDTDDGDTAALTVAEVNGDAANVGATITVSDGEGRTGDLTVQPDGTFEFVPSDDFDELAEGQTTTVAFTYVADDDQGANSRSNEATATITITGVNDRPTANAVAIPASEDGDTVIGSFDGDDVDEGDTLTYTITRDLADGEGSVINNGDGTFSYDPGDDFQELAENATTQVTFDYSAMDAALTSLVDGTVTVTVTGFNDAPAFDVLALATELGGTNDNGVIRVNLGQGATLMADLSLFVSDIDGDDQAISFTRVANNLPGESFGSNEPELLSTGELEWTADSDQTVGEYTIRVSASDAELQATLLDIVVTVQAAIP